MTKIYDTPNEVKLVIAVNLSIHRNIIKQCKITSDWNVLSCVLVCTWTCCSNGSKWCVDLSSSSESGGTPRTRSSIGIDHATGRSGWFSFP